MVICFPRKGVISNEKENSYFPESGRHVGLCKKSPTCLPYDMDMKSGRFTVDAKSLFGLLNLGLERKIELKVYDENCDALFEDIAPYLAA